MLCTTTDISKINHNNYTNWGFPFPKESGIGYEYIRMTNMDEDGYPSDNSYINSVGPTPAWKCWNSGEWLCEPVNSELGQVLHGNSGGN